MTDDPRKTQLDDELEEMERHSQELAEKIADVREDWERKQADSAVPGAVGDPASGSGDELPPPEPDETD